jgi:cytochrome oxidase Cu insertion factor (SCO1/SenC/PrrC family)
MANPAAAAVPGFRPRPQERVGAAGGVSARLPGVVLHNHRDEPRRLREDLVAGQRVVLSFLYTRCTEACPRTVEQLREVYHQLRARETGRFRFLTLSVDPAYDTPERLLRYAVRRGVAGFPDWEFLTGEPADVTAVLRAWRALEPVEPGGVEDPGSHTGMVILGNDATHRWSAIAAGAGADLIANLFLRVARPGSFGASLAQTAE